MRNKPLNPKLPTRWFEKKERKKVFIINKNNILVFLENKSSKNKN
jgi:hypothetical protein